MGKGTGPAFTVQAIVQRTVEGEADKAVSFFDAYPGALESAQEAFQSAHAALPSPEPPPESIIILNLPPLPAPAVRQASQGSLWPTTPNCSHDYHPLHRALSAKASAELDGQASARHRRHAHFRGVHRTPGRKCSRHQRTPVRGSLRREAKEENRWIN
jgi:hypothetical protein